MKRKDRREGKFFYSAALRLRADITGRICPKGAKLAKVAGVRIPYPTWIV